MTALAAKTDTLGPLSALRAIDTTPERADEAARYIGQMAGEMALIARSARLELLAYFLEMARIEAHSVAGRAIR